MDFRLKALDYGLRIMELQAIALLYSLSTNLVTVDMDTPNLITIPLTSYTKWMWRHTSTTPLLFFFGAKPPYFPDLNKCFDKHPFWFLLEKWNWNSNYFAITFAATESQEFLHTLHCLRYNILSFNCLHCIRYILTWKNVWKKFPSVISKLLKIKRHTKFKMLLIWKRKTE